MLKVITSETTSVSEFDFTLTFFSPVHKEVSLRFIDVKHFAIFISKAAY